MSKHEYKVGDRVRLNNPHWSYGGRSFDGEHGTVTDPADTTYGPEPAIRVDLDMGQVVFVRSLTALELTEAKTTSPGEPDVVRHPNHYSAGTPDGIEVIDIIRAHMAAGGTWETANALKYILRHTLKDNPKQDIAKAGQYLTMWTEQQETETEATE